MSLEAESLDLFGSQIPINKFYDFEDITFLLKFKKNRDGNFFTVEVFDSLGINFIFGNKLVYGVNVFDSISAPTTEKLIPLNINILKGEQGTEEINEETLGNAIKLYTDILE